MAKLNRDPNRCFYCGSTRARLVKGKLYGKPLTFCSNNAQCERRCGEILKKAGR